MELKRIAIGTSKQAFTIPGSITVIERCCGGEFRQVHVAAFFAKVAPSEIGLEARAGSHHWGRLLY
jgi:transposase